MGPMASTSPGDERELVKCARCGGAYNVEGASEVDASRTRMRCADCGHTEEVLLSRGVTESGKWTVIDPSGKVLAFATLEELVAYQQGATKKAEEPPKAEQPANVGEAPKVASERPRKDPTAALLDDLPSQPLLAPQRLEMVDSETDVSKHDEEPAPMSAEPMSAPEPDPEDSKDEEQPLSSRDFTVLPVPKLPPGASVAPKPVASIPPPLPERARSIAPQPQAQEEPKKKKKERLEIEEPQGPSTVLSATTVEAAKRAAPKKDEEKVSFPKKDAEKAPKKPAEIAHEELMKSEAPVAPVAPAPTEEQKNGWLVPMLAVAAIIAVVWYVANGGGNGPKPADTTSPTGTPTSLEPTQPAASVGKTATAPSASTELATPAPSGSVLPRPLGSGVVPTGTERIGMGIAPRNSAGAIGPAPSDSTAPDPNEKPKAPATIAELLDQAAAARRGGDPAKARELYEKVLAQSPSSVEALYGLGTVARAEGNLAGAKAAYEKALAVNGSFFPALLGLADAEWDMGDRASAKNHYGQLVHSSPNAPPRAKERAESTE